MVEPIPRNRRAEDPRLAEILELARESHELVGLTARRVTELAGKVDKWERRMAIVERIAADSKKLQEEFGVDQLNPKQKRRLPEVLEWWDERAHEAADIAENLHRNSLRSTVAQGVTAVLLLLLTVFTVIEAVRRR